MALRSVVATVALALSLLTAAPAEAAPPPPRRQVCITQMQVIRVATDRTGRPIVILVPRRMCRWV